jgi:hypothetical protein
MLVERRKNSEDDVLYGSSANLSEWSWCVRWRIGVGLLGLASSACSSVVVEDHDAYNRAAASITTGGTGGASGENGRVYDAFTGSVGVTIAEFKALWEFPEVIDFGF